MRSEKERCQTGRSPLPLIATPIMERITSLLSDSTPLKWLFYGDSITHGAFHLAGSRDYTEHFTERVRSEMGRSRDVVIKTAISGNTTRDLLNDFDWRAGQLRHNVVFLMIGMNDCSTTRELPLEEFEANLHKLTDRFEEIGTLIVFQTTCPIVPGTAPDREPRFFEYMEAIRRVAAARGYPLVDHTAHWQAHADQHFLWMSNAFHPNAHGHLAFARFLHQRLGIHDPQSITGRLFLY